MPAQDLIVDLAIRYGFQVLGAIVILKAFAAGGSALTGIEAIANGVPTFRQPRARRCSARC